MFNRGIPEKGIQNAVSTRDFRTPSMKSYEKIKLLVQLPHNSNAVVEGGPRTEGRSNTREMCERDICFAFLLSHKTAW